MMTGSRAALVLRGLEKNQLTAEAHEIDELLKRGMAVEAFPEQLRDLGRLCALRDEFFEYLAQHPFSREAMVQALADVERKLKDEWYRLRTAKARLQEHERHRVELRWALGLLSDPAEQAALRRIMEDARLLEQGTNYVACASLGSEVYAITQLGMRVRAELKLRLARFGEAPFASFLKAFEKTDAKMTSLGDEIAKLSYHVGHVRKNKDQVVIGLVKSGLPANQALAAYHESMQHTFAPDVAVTCTRSAVAFGGTAIAAQMLQRATQALYSEGFPHTPIVSGAAKSLLAWNPPESAAPRFVELFRGVNQLDPRRGDARYKLTARLMPAFGWPREVIARVVRAGHLLAASPPATGDALKVGVALASMVKSDDQLPALVERYLAIARELVRSGLSHPSAVEDHALECVACAGTPDEVVASVRALCRKLAGQRGLGDPMAVAVAFAKRFAY
jgi:hypothetical protein